MDLLWLFGVSSVMRMLPSVIRDCTWACPAVKRTSTAAPTCRPTCLSREAPKRPSGSPRYSAPPNSHKMVITLRVLLCVVLFNIFLLHVFLFSHIKLNLMVLCFQWTFWLFWTGRPILTECWTSSVDCVKSVARRLSRSLFSDDGSNNKQDVNGMLWATHYTNYLASTAMKILKWYNLFLYSD